jgi:hypothetical protein
MGAGRLPVLSIAVPGAPVCILPTTTQAELQELSNNEAGLLLHGPTISSWEVHCLKFSCSCAAAQDCTALLAASDDFWIGGLDGHFYLWTDGTGNMGLRSRLAGLTDRACYQNALGSLSNSTSLNPGRSEIYWVACWHGPF